MGKKKKKSLIVMEQECIKSDFSHKMLSRIDMRISSVWLDSDVVFEKLQKINNFL